MVYPRPAHRIASLICHWGSRQLLKKIYPLHAGPNTFVFTDGEGKPIDQSEFQRKSFAPVLRQAARFLYTRHTFISVIVTHRPEKLKWLSDKVGTSMESRPRYAMSTQTSAPVIQIRTWWK